jgi:hypothetical protein
MFNQGEEMIVTNMTMQFLYKLQKLQDSREIDFLINLAICYLKDQKEVDIVVAFGNDLIAQLPEPPIHINIYEYEPPADDTGDFVYDADLKASYEKQAHDAEVSYHM